MPSGRDFDVVLFGATGYTGDHVARALNRLAGGDWPGVRWAIAGRSESKLKALAAKHDLSPTGVIVADTSDPASLRAMAGRGAVVMNATGPYRFYGEAVVEACISEKADYVDLCGEPEFIDRCLLKHAEGAAAAGVILVHSCAFDSVPADIGCLFTALQFEPPALCAQASMYHTVDIKDVPEAKTAGGHATTFYAAVHGFAGVKATRAQRKELVMKLEAAKPGSSKPPAPLGLKLRVVPGPTWIKDLKKYAFLFPGSDVAVVRNSQRTLSQLPPKAGEPYLTPQFGASFCVSSTKSAAITATFGLLFNFLVQRAWGRKLLLGHPELFTNGTFSDHGPTEEALLATSFKTVFLAKGWSHAFPESVPATGFDVAVRTSVSGPEPGYHATALMFAVMARTVLEDRASFGVTGGVFTPGGLVGSGGALAVKKIVQRYRNVGINFEAEERKAIVPRAPGGETKRPAWQTALNAVAWAGWSRVVVSVLQSWQETSFDSGSSLSRGVLALESICVFEVLQIVLGMAKGNVALGLGIHYTRMLMMLAVLPRVPTSFATKMVLLGWAATEVCRYPMFLFPKAGITRVMRYLAPVATFPIASGAEAVAAYQALSHLTGSGLLLRGMVAAVVPFNCFGWILFYPGLVKKGFASLKAQPGDKGKAD